jgi:hypothetical protein
MPGMFFAVPGTNTIEALMQGGLPMHQRGMHALWGRGYPGIYRHEQNDEKNPWTYQGGWWPSQSRFICDPADPLGQTELMGACLGGFRSGQYEPMRVGYGGNATLKYIMGKCKDASGVAIGGAVVSGFRTSTDQLIRRTVADSQGNYELGTEYLGENHYIVAYSAGSPDRAGMTINTLQPTNRDGS